MAKAIKRTKQRVIQLVHMDILKKSEFGKYDLWDNIHRFIDYQDSQIKGHGSLTLTDERTRLTKINADRKNLQLEKERGELLHVDTVMKLHGAVFQNIRSKMLAIPSKLAPLTYGARTIPEIEATLRKAIYECLEEVAEPELRALPGMAGDKGNTKNTKAAKKPADIAMGRRRKSAKS